MCYNNKVNSLHGLPQIDFTLICGKFLRVRQNVFVQVYMFSLVEQWKPSVVKDLCR